MSDTDVSVVIPAYNEASVLEHSVNACLDALEQSFDSFEVVIVDSASEGATPEVAAELATEHAAVKRTEEPAPGRGIAVATGFRTVKGDALGFMHADLGTGLWNTPKILSTLSP